MVTPGKRKKTHVFAPLIGEMVLAVKLFERGIVCLDRADLSVLSEFEGGSLFPAHWLGDHLLVADEDGNLVAWDGVKGGTIWSAPGAERGSAVWRGHAVLAPSPGRLALHDGETGEDRPISLGKGGLASFRVVGNVLVYQTEERELVGFDMEDEEERWRLSLRDSFGDMAWKGSKKVVRILATPSSDSVVVHWSPALGRLDVATGRFLWKAEAMAGGGAAIAHGRVAFLFAGSLFLFDVSTGRTIVDGQQVLPTVYESNLKACPDGFVAVDEQGYIVTIDSAAGEVLGVQREKGASFNGCAVVDDRLLVGGSDGALWEYERRRSGTSTADASPPGPSGRRSEAADSGTDTSKRSQGRGRSAARGKK
jgi:outer membrane protein assembly factor BamB